MVKIEVIFHFNFNEDEVEWKGQELLDKIREMFTDSMVEEDFEKDCKIVKIKFIKEEVEPF